MKWIANRFGCWDLVFFNKFQRMEGQSGRTCKQRHIPSSFCFRSSQSSVSQSIEQKRYLRRSTVLRTLAGTLSVYIQPARYILHHQCYGAPVFYCLIPID